MSTHTADEAPSGAPPRVPEWTIGDRIRKARREAELSQQRLADAVGVTVHQIGNWEAGYNKPEDIIGVARAIARVTGVRADWIAGLYDGGEVVDASGGRAGMRRTDWFSCSSGRIRSRLHRPDRVSVA